MADAYNVSTLGMVAVPYLLLGTIGFLLWRASRVPPPPPGAGQGPGPGTGPGSGT